MERQWLDNDKVAVWGLGKSGVAAANLLARQGYEVVASDIGDRDQLSGALGELDERIDVELGCNSIGNAKWVVTSPGLPPTLEVFEEARRQGIPVVSEVELAHAFSDARWLAITGTDGKTTTTTLLGEMVKASGAEHAVAGNIGTPLCDIVESLSPGALLVVELSANQLWTCHGLSTQAAAITNIAEDHVDYFVDATQYEEAKKSLVTMQNKGTTAVLPGGRIHWKRGLLTARSPGEVIEFSHRPQEVEESYRAVYFDQGVGYWRIGDKQGIWCPDFSEVELIGPHNQSNAACAAALAWSAGVEWEATARGLAGVAALPHRMEPVAVIEEVSFIDDSKATNAHASWAGLQGVEGGVVAIVGGLDKGLKLDQWADDVGRHVDAVVVMGAIKERMVALFKDKPVEVRRAGSMAQAVREAKKIARPGSTVVLSPACSSYDMYSNYRERGRAFQDAVRRLESSPINQE